MNTIKKIIIRIYKMRNFILLLFITSLVLLFISKLPKNYTLEYNINNYKVIEKFDKKKKYYYFTFKSNKDTFKYITKHGYISTKKLINKVNYKAGCLSFKSKIINDTICKNSDGKYVTSYYDKKVINKKTSKYKNINIYNLDDYKYYIWNYRAIISIDNKNQSEIKLFKNDLYNINLVGIYKKYLIIPDYNNEYYFKKIYMINSKNDKIKELELNKNIYFDSYFLGNYRNKIYLYDINKEKEYTINPHNGRVEDTAYKILINGKFEKTSNIKLNKKKQVFTDNKDYQYYIKDNMLYYKTPVNEVLVTNLEVSKLIYEDNENAFFISKDTLYHINYSKGLNKVMSYSEWNFNMKNIYIFPK